MQKKRVILVGFFGGEANSAKLGFYLTHFDAAVFEEPIVLDASSDRGNYLSAKCYKFPAWLHTCTPTASNLFSGIIFFFYLFARWRRLLWDVLALDASVCMAQSGSIPLRLLRIFYFPVGFLIGLGRIRILLRKLQIDEKTCVVLWSEHFSGTRIVRRVCEVQGAKLIFAEYGEVPGTIFSCGMGMFHESWPTKISGKFNLLSVSKDDLNFAQTRLREISENRISTKTDMYGKERVCRKQIDLTRPVIYVNAAQSFCSGLIPRRSEFSKEFSPHYSSNERILDSLAQLAEMNNWTILYKEHPNTLAYFPRAGIRRNRWGDHVVLLENVDIHEVLSVADITVSLGSKSVFLSLAVGVPVCLLGPYSISGANLEYGLAEGRPLEENLRNLLRRDRGERVDHLGLVNYLARLYRYYLYTLDDTSNTPFDRSSVRFWDDCTQYLEGRRSVLTTSEVDSIHM